MLVNKNQDVLQYSGRAPIVRMEIPSDTALHMKRIVETFESSILLFKTNQCFAFQYLYPLREELENRLPHKQTAFTYISEKKYQSLIVYANRDNKRMLVYDTSDFSGTFRKLEKLINDRRNRIPIVKIQELHNDHREDGIPLESRKMTVKKPYKTKHQSDRIREPISVAKCKARRQKLRKVELPRRIALLIRPTYPLDDLEYGLPIREEGFRAKSERAVSGQLTRSERQRPDINSATGHYIPYNSDSHSLFNHANTSPPPMHPEYKDYAKRKASFSHWPHSSPTVTQFCDAGLFFTKQGDLVRCFQCGIGLKDFTNDDDPLLEHVRHSENCAFLKESLDSDIIERIKTRSHRSNIPQSYTEIQTELTTSNYASYRHPEYSTIEARLETFKNWPSAHGQSALQLAEAGLFYTGYDDLVRCCACDGGLRRWEPEDDPWIEHCRWFPTCQYVREKKGDEFIAMVQAMVVDEDEVGASGGQGVASAMQKLTLASPQVKTILDEHRATVVEMMGFDENDFSEAVLELKMRDASSSVEDIIELIEIIQERKRKEIEDVKEENPLELNKRLKRFLVCTRCKKNEADALFLPCAHHNTCMACAKSLSVCPSCNRAIKETLKTYLG